MQSVNKKLNTILDSKAKQEDYDVCVLNIVVMDDSKVVKEKEEKSDLEELDKVREKEIKCRKRRRK